MKLTRAQLERRVLLWQDRLWQLGIGHWRLMECTIVDDMEDEQASAGVKPSSYYDHCWMRFQKTWLENADERELDETIIHEWLHVSWRDMTDAIEQIEPELGLGQRLSWHARIEHETEGIIERTARALYDFYTKNVVR